MSKKIAIFLLVLTLVLGTSGPVEAKKKLPASTRTTSSVSSSTGVSVRIRSDRRAIIANFSNLGAANSVSYTLSYTSRGIGQGVGGSIPNTTNSASREIIFGTCSGGVCRYDSGITNAKLVITLSLKNGRKVIKTFRIKV